MWQLILSARFQRPGVALSGGPSREPFAPLTPARPQTYDLADFGFVEGALDP